MRYDVIPAESKHIDGIFELEKACFSLPWTRENISAYLPDDMHTMLCAVDDAGKVVGYIGLMYVLDEGYIANVAVSQDHRRQGIGTKLLAALVNEAKKRSLSFLTLEVRESNESAIALYKNAGFSEVGIRKNYYDKPTENAILMTKFL